MTDKKGAFILFSALLRVRSDVFFCVCFSLMALAKHIKHCLSWAPFYFSAVNYKDMLSVLRLG